MFKRTTHLMSSSSHLTSSKSSHHHYDICIIGAGLVGSTLARTLECSPFTKHLKIALIDRPNHFSKMNNYKFNANDPGLRCSALNATSADLLNRIQVWNRVQSKTPYTSMKIWDRNNTILQFDTHDVVGGGGSASSLSSLSLSSSNSNNMIGCMIDNDDLLSAVWNRMDNVDRLQANDVTRLEDVHDSNTVKVHFNNSDSSASISAKLIVGCDGQESIVRKSGNFSGLTYKYPLRSFVCSVECDRSIPTAMQKFANSGVLALLPMYSTGSKHVYNIVFTTNSEYAQELSKMTESQVVAQLNSIWDMKNGEAPMILKLNSPIKGSFPLSRSHVDQYHAWNGKLFVMGDAAHTMLPIAGQGLNAGMYDITEFVAALQNSLESGHEINTFNTGGNTRMWWWRNESVLRGVEHIRGVYGVGEMVQQHHLAGDILDKARGLGLTVLNWRNNPISEAVRRELVQTALGTYARTGHLGPEGTAVPISSQE